MFPPSSHHSKERPKPLASMLSSGPGVCPAATITDCGCRPMNGGGQIPPEVSRDTVTVSVSRCAMPHSSVTRHQYERMAELTRSLFAVSSASGRCVSPLSPAYHWYFTRGQSQATVNVACPLRVFTTACCGETETGGSGQVPQYVTEAFFVKI